MRHAKPIDSPTAATDSISERVVDAVADHDGVSPLDISPPLFDAIDPDALDRLFADGRTGVTVAFSYAGYRVTVRDGGRVELGPVGD